MQAASARRSSPPARDAPPSPALYLVAFVVLGLMSNLAGPGLSTLRTQVGASLGDIGLIFTAGSLGGLVGAIGGGRGFDRGLGHKLLGGVYLCAAAALLILPLATALTHLCVGFFALGACAGVIDVGCNSLIVWGNGGRRSVGSLLNALHLCFGLGALLAPTAVFASIEHSPGLTGFCVALAALASATGLALWLRVAPRPPTTTEPGSAPESTAVAAASASTRARTRRLLIAGSVFYVLYVGLEVGFAGWIPAYAEEIRLGSAAAAAGLTTTFWLAFSFGRLLSIGAARRWPPARMLTAANIAALFASGLLLYAGGTGTHPAILWLATALFGLAIAPQFPTMLAWAEANLTFTASATSWFIAASAIGGLLVPWTIGQLLEAHGGLALPTVVLALSAALAAWFALMTVMARPGPEPSRRARLAGERLR